MKNYTFCISYFLMVIFFTDCTYNQVYDEVPNTKLIHWSEAGYRNIQEENLPTYNDSILIPLPTNNPELNFKNITKAISKASKMKGLTVVILGAGRYNINKPIVFRNGLDRIILKGSEETF